MPKKTKPAKSLVPVADAASVILLDRTGSMSANWAETISAINAYAETLAQAAPAMPITLLAFDSHAGSTEVVAVRDAVPAKDWAPLTGKETPPRGMTPLNDAVLDAVGRAERLGAAKVALAVVTDGGENCSREATRADAKAALDRARGKGWDVVFLGADFDAFAEAAAVGTAAANTLNVKSGSYVGAMSNLAVRASGYAAGTLRAGEAFSEQDRKRASGGA